VTSIKLNKRMTKDLFFIGTPELSAIVSLRQQDTAQNATATSGK